MRKLLKRWKSDFWIFFASFDETISTPILNYKRSYSHSYIHDTTGRAIWLDWRVLTNIIYIVVTYNEQFMRQNDGREG